MKEVYDKNFNVVGYRAKTLKYILTNKTRSADYADINTNSLKYVEYAKHSHLPRYAIVHRHHIHGFDSVDLVVERWGKR
jgi:hypothetical protein